MRIPAFWLAFICLLLACSSSKSKDPHILIKTQVGDIELELYPDNAPVTVKAFLTYVDSGFYRNSSFYRVLNDDNQSSDAPKSELIQGGIWKTNYKKAISQSGIPHESTKQTHILHTDGVISLARTTPGTAGTEFFICVGNQPGFDFGGDNNPDGQGYAAFGKVVKGLDVIRNIYSQPENNQSFTPRVPIFNIIRL
jgi:peptidyl-prolyl cis-trans isomerase A (cyclophilin A)